MWRRLLVALLLPTAILSAQVPRLLPAADAIHHVGERATVCGPIAAPRPASTIPDLPTFIDLGHPFPHPTFTIILYNSDKQRVGDLPLSGNVCVTGTIRQYRGVALMVLSSRGGWSLQTPPSAALASVPSPPISPRTPTPPAQRAPSAPASELASNPSAPPAQPAPSAPASELASNPSAPAAESASVASAEVPAQSPIPPTKPASVAYAEVPAPNPAPAAKPASVASAEVPAQRPTPAPPLKAPIPPPQPAVAAPAPVLASQPPAAPSESAPVASAEVPAPSPALVPSPKAPTPPPQPAPSAPASEIPSKPSVPPAESASVASPPVPTPKPPTGPARPAPASSASVTSSRTTTRPADAPPASSPAAAASASAPPKPIPGQSLYRIGPDDSLRIDVWNEPTLSGTCLVRPDGKISMVLLDDVRAAGLTPMQLAAALTKRYKEFLQDPLVSVIVVAPNSQKIYLIGEVQHVGPLEMATDMSPLQAIAAAGGLTPYANAKKIYILRGPQGKQHKIPFNYKNALSGKPGPTVKLLPGDTIVVP